MEKGQNWELTPEIVLLMLILIKKTGNNKDVRNRNLNKIPNASA